MILVLNHIVTLCGLYVFDTKQVIQPVLDSSFKNSFQDNGESTHFDADTFDIVQYSYVLHEMPMENAHALLSEAYRILKPGGVLSGFEGMFLHYCKLTQYTVAELLQLRNLISGFKSIMIF